MKIAKAIEILSIHITNLEEQLKYKEFEIENLKKKLERSKGSNEYEIS